MPIPVYPKQLAELLRKNEAGIANTADSSQEADQSVIREMRVQDSYENNNDPNDMPLEIKKNEESDLDPIDTEAEIKKSLQP
ncbi:MULTISPECIES: hypothetical protein [Legionella]|uniref:Uncharacterized protein n=1 Tax=Legionella donaldsonii TaxID=45060 RepID=A0A378J8U7_9GAMM|nr:MULTISPECIES: hypothetical protein [Legionella]MCC5013701.1 hypothetical protein [Legionella sp. 31fI33]STX43786.1 Uncharacterised protein [Legionella donaldsonii]